MKPEPPSDNVKVPRQNALQQRKEGDASCSESNTSTAASNPAPNVPPVTDAGNELPPCPKCDGPMMLIGSGQAVCQRCYRGLSDAECLQIIGEMVGKACDEDVIMAVERALANKRAASSVSGGPRTLDAKWLDPECWDGCQSLVFKGERDKLRAFVKAYFIDGVLRFPDGRTYREHAKELLSKTGGGSGAKGASSLKSESTSLSSHTPESEGGKQNGVL